MIIYKILLEFFFYAGNKYWYGSEYIRFYETI